MQVRHLCMVATLSLGCVAVAASPRAPAIGEVLTVEPLVEPVVTRELQLRCWKLRDADGIATDGYVRRCVRVWPAAARTETTGYQVEYRYRGRIGRMRTERHPGDHVRIRHAWEAIHF